MSYTPGPWKVVNGFENLYIRPDTRGLVAKIWAHAGGYEAEGEAHANARLIAAAPELVEALEEVLREWANSARVTMSYESEIKARALLDRIKGEA